ncbi:MYND finger domain-containing protein [Cryptosporidium muris RN66]|uniref:MYND finger domain-containing protein n=1 Tax=Cryptosporidium muris (strain RN66) TaxID=441375 RepID=B6AE99_CRYMR|nr:MYND finger domain-containing protein [Cryptosporidium muris RN66]EEA06845.1 MYND finger domain-containing protein [Cryptosporidium muris RN66]|eukprot:XP_002141194.1 MYND finger domain-containing protein [Cryptosporidium muris RN66]
MDCLDNIYHESFKYIYIPYHESDKVEQMEFSGKEGHFRKRLQQHFRSKLRNEEIVRLQKSIQLETSISDSLLGEAINSSQTYEIISLILPKKENNYRAVNAYIDSVGRIKDMPINPRASRICSSNIRGDCFISASFDNEDIFKRVNFTIEDYEIMYNNPPPKENRWDVSKIGDIINNPINAFSNKEKADLTRCENCRITSLPLMRCGRCKKVLYCSVTCQKEDWKYHKRICK